MTQTGFPNRNGAYTWHQDPRALHDSQSGKTWFGYVDSDGSIKIFERDPGGDDIESVLASELFVDDHIGPTILLRNDGHLVVFYARYTDVLYRVSTAPRDASEFGAEQSITTSASYPNPVQMDSDEIYLFTRETDFQQGYRTSTDGGDSWDTWTQLTDFAPDRAYLKQFPDPNGTDIHLTIHRTNSGDTSNSDFWDHVIFATDVGEIQDTDGTTIATESELPLTASDLGSVATGDGTDPNQMRVWDLALDGDNRARVLYAKMDDRDAHEYYHARWDGSSWQTSDITLDAGGGINELNRDYYSGGLCFDHGDLSTVYLSQQVGGQHQIYEATTADNGATWSLSELATSNVLDYRPCPIRSPDADGLSFVWLNGSFIDFTNYNTRVVSTEAYGSFRRVGIDVEGSGQPTPKHYDGSGQRWGQLRTFISDSS
jgi:hypothetical protein